LGADRWSREMIGVRGMLGVALAMAALALACALLAAPAFADARAHGGTLQYVDCDQVQSAVAFQYNAGSSSDVNQELNVTRDQERVCRGDRDGRNDGKKADGVLADTIVKGTLPDTGGFSLLALAAYALVVTGIFSITRLIGRRR
jgi:hypothetical protein